MLAWYFKKLVLKYFSWHSVDTKSSLNNGVIIFRSCHIFVYIKCYNVCRRDKVEILKLFCKYIYIFLYYVVYEIKTTTNKFSCEAHQNFKANELGGFLTHALVYSWL